jgi:probable addiction module antidote protein
MAKTPVSAGDLAAGLCASLEQDPGDGSSLRVALGEVARAQGMMKISRETGLAREALYRALSDRGNPELATVLKVLKALGLQLSIRPAKARRTRRA